MLARSIVRLLVVVAVSLFVAGPVMALAGGGGGLPAVELDEPPPSEILVGQPVTVGFMVLSHGSPRDGVAAHLEALHKESKESFRVDAIADDTRGHLMVEAIFHEVGTWFWEIVLPEFGTSTTLSPVNVVAEGSASAAIFGPGFVGVPAAIQEGGCGSVGPTLFALEDLSRNRVGSTDVGSKMAMPVSMSESTIDARLDDLVAGDHAITVAIQDAANLLACGEIGGIRTDDTLAFGLQGADDSGWTGIAVLEADGDQTNVSVYLTYNASSSPTAASGAATGETVTLDIVGSVFSAPSLTVDVGDTVTWTNRDPVAHTVSFDDMALADSPVMEQGDAFSVTFDTPGAYSYICNPHPFMTGMVVVR
ncbi:MAG: cupredoxin domain-containing protein [Thermomicrobiales bacterium]